MATVALLALGIMPASAAPGDPGGGQPQQGPPAAASALTPEQAADTVRLAEQTGVPSAVLLREAVGQEGFSALVERMRSDYPDHFVDGVWEPRGTTRGRIVLVAGAPQAAVDAVAAGPGIEVRSTRTLSEQERLAATEAAYQAATAEVGVAEAAVTSDPATGAVDVLFVATPGIPGNAERVRAAARGRASMAAGRDIAATVSQAPELNIGEPEYRGGMRYNGSLGSCTAAFTPQSGSTYGISTAAHCGSAPTTVDRSPPSGWPRRATGMPGGHGRPPVRHRRPSRTTPARSVPAPAARTQRWARGYASSATRPATRAAPSTRPGSESGA